MDNDRYLAPAGGQHKAETMLIRKKADIPESEVTDRALFEDRRRIIKAGAGLSAAMLAGGAGLLPAADAMAAGKKIRARKNSRYDTDEEPTPYKKATRYNNFYEFGTGKSDPYENAQDFRTRPWTIAIEGEVEQPGRFDLDDFLRPFSPEERIYRLRCVEAWSMVIPWVGIPLGDIIKRYRPTSKAKYVEFTTLYDPEQMPGQRRQVLQWPYVEGLRIDEATHPLTLFAIGLYGEELPNQNGAPIRLVVPWKYGFKSIKSIVKMRFTEKQPINTWNRTAPNEYGFYANVNPEVDHPRWSQARERRIGDFFKRETLMFNGYAEQVAGLYRDLDLRRNF